LHVYIYISVRLYVNKCVFGLLPSACCELVCQRNGVLAAVIETRLLVRDDAPAERSIGSDWGDESTDQSIPSVKRPTGHTHTHTHTDREQHSRHRHTHTRQENVNTTSPIPRCATVPLRGVSIPRVNVNTTAPIP